MIAETPHLPQTHSEWEMVLHEEFGIMSIAGAAMILTGLILNSIADINIHTAKKAERH